MQADSVASPEVEQNIIYHTAFEPRTALPVGHGSTYIKYL